MRILSESSNNRSCIDYLVDTSVLFRKQVESWHSCELYVVDTFNHLITLQRRTESTVDNMGSISIPRSGTFLLKIRPKIYEII